MSIKILHSGDWHIGAFPGPVISGENARMMDTVKCIEFLVEQAQLEKVDVVLISGDLFHKSKLWADQMLKEISIAVKYLRLLTEICPVILMFGTENHDSRQAFENIRAMQIPDLIVSTAPELLFVSTNSGMLQVATLPGFDKGYFRAQFPGMDATQENIECSRLLGDMVMGLNAQLTEEYPSVLMSHYTVVGCQLDNGEHVFQQQEVVLPREALQTSSFDLVCLGHIHAVQFLDNCGRPTWYSGGINCFTHGESGQAKGFLVHEITSLTRYIDGTMKRDVITKFITAPYRRFLTQKMDDYDVKHFIENGTKVWYELDNEGAPYYESVENAVVRVHYACSDDLDKQLNRKALEKALHDAGAFWVSEIKREMDNVALIKEGMSENSDPLDNLLQWLEDNGSSLEDAAPLIELSKPLIDTVSVKLPAGKLSGLFVPRRITVRNYRSYSEESMDFEKINFAVVTGDIGTGKSSLFMDAPNDCLYEEPREGDLTGWISNGEKSGMIDFEFGMGETVWKVVRTRLRSGKVTLSLQEQVEGQWVDRSEPKKDDTQKKIVALLGMDAMTFKCCGLIMQGAYGLFLEADREDRMSVLGNILGLGVYDQLEKLAKDKITETNRELEKLKQKVADIDNELKEKPAVKENLATVEAELKESEQAVTMKELELQALEAQIRELQTKVDRAEELKKQVDVLAQEIAAKEAEKAKQQALFDGAGKRLEMEEKILEKAAEYEQVNVAVAVLKAKEPRLAELRKENQKLNTDLSQTEQRILNVNSQLAELEKFLSNRTELEQAAEQYKQAVIVFDRQSELNNKRSEINLKIMEIEKNTDRISDLVTHWQSNLDETKNKVKMLEDSGCIDSEKATCLFLADAQEAKASISRIEAIIDEKKAEHKALYEQVQALEKDEKAIGYDMDAHFEADQTIKKLRGKAELAAALQAKVELLENLKKQSEREEEQRTKLVEQHHCSIIETSKLTEELKPLSTMEERLPKLKAWVAAKDELPQARQLKISSEERIEQLRVEINSKSLQQADIELQIDSLVTAFPERSEKKVYAERTTTELADLRDRQNSIHAQIGGLKTKLEVLEKLEFERAELAKDMEPKAKLLVQYQVLAKAFGQDGVPFAVIRSVVAELSAKANDILGQMTGGKMSLVIETERIQKSNKREVNTLDIKIIDYIRGSLPYLSRSGGQKVSSALSMAFAIAALKAQRAGIQLGMLFLDEPPFLSADAIDAYCDALEVISAVNSNMKVIAISHDPSLKARFPQVIEVIDTGEGGSKVMIT